MKLPAHNTLARTEQICLPSTGRASREESGYSDNITSSRTNRRRWFASSAMASARSLRCARKQRCTQCGDAHPANEQCQGKYCPNGRTTGHTALEASACPFRERADEKFCKRVPARRQSKTTTTSAREHQQDGVGRKTATTKAAQGACASQGRQSP